MRRILPVFLLLWASALTAQESAEFTDPKLLLNAVAKIYADGAEAFRIEAIETTTRKNELEDSRNTVYRTAIQGPGNLYRIEARSPYGSYTQVSDGTTEWVYLSEVKMYVSRPVPQNWPEFPRVFIPGEMELNSAWNMRTWLEAEIGGSEPPTMMPQETIAVEGRSYPCYVVHVTWHRNQDAQAERTYWIDKKALTIRKRVIHEDSHVIVTKAIHLPIHTDYTAIYPVVDFSPQTREDIFRFTPPADAKKIDSMEPDLGGPPPSDHPKAQLAGQTAPDATLVSADGSKVALSSLRGKPVLLDFWATWCGPCLVAMPSMHRVYDDVKDKGMEMIAIDEDNRAEDAVNYLSRHKYSWNDFHDAGKQVQNAFKGEAIPLVVLIDAQGKIVYYDFGGNEETLRRAIASLGPGFASVAPAVPAQAAAKKN